MSPLKVLVVGGGIGGPSLAFWLTRLGHSVTIVERYPSLRALGAQIDIRAQGIDVVKRMGLLETIRTKLVDEDGVAWIDKHGKVAATIYANKSGKGAQSLTSEYEIMRGDLVKVLYEATKDTTKYVFGKTVDGFKQDIDGVTAYFSDNSTERFDILVGADGQGSRIRKAILPPNAPEPYNRLGIMMAYYMMPTIASDSSIRKGYRVPGRGFMARTHSPTESQAYLILRDDDGKNGHVPRAPMDEQKEFWASRFRNCGWQSDRFMDALEKTDTLYCQEIVQVKTDTWHKGRVVLLGDAGYCPSPMSGMGTTSAFVGAYVLAGEIARHADDLGTAFAEYDRVMRPFVKEAQKVSPYLKNLFVPATQWGIDVFLFFAAIACWLKIPALLSRFSSQDKGGWKVPEYSELRSKAQ